MESDKVWKHPIHGYPITYQELHAHWHHPSDPNQWALRHVEVAKHGRTFSKTVLNLQYQQSRFKNLGKGHKSKRRFKSARQRPPSKMYKSNVLRCVNKLQDFLAKHNRKGWQRKLKRRYKNHHSDAYSLFGKVSRQTLWRWSLMTRGSDAYKLLEAQARRFKMYCRAPCSPFVWRHGAYPVFEKLLCIARDIAAEGSRYRSRLWLMTLGRRVLESKLWSKVLEPLMEPAELDLWTRKEIKCTEKYIRDVSVCGLGDALRIDLKSFLIL